MKPAVYTLTVPSGAAAEIPVGYFVAARLQRISLVMASAATGAVTIDLVRGANTVRLHSVTLAGATNFSVGFDSPVILTPTDKIVVTTSATGVAATAYVEFQP